MNSIGNQGVTVKPVIDELNNTFGASKSSIFLNPARVPAVARRSSMQVQSGFRNNKTRIR